MALQVGDKVQLRAPNVVGRMLNSHSMVITPGAYTAVSRFLRGEAGLPAVIIAIMGNTIRLAGQGNIRFPLELFIKTRESRLASRSSLPECVVYHDRFGGGQRFLIEETPKTHTVQFNSSATWKALLPRETAVGEVRQVLRELGSNCAISAREWTEFRSSDSHSLEIHLPYIYYWVFVPNRFGRPGLSIACRTSPWEGGSEGFCEIPLPNGSSVCLGEDFPDSIEGFWEKTAVEKALATAKYYWDSAFNLDIYPMYHGFMLNVVLLAFLTKIDPQLILKLPWNDEAPEVYFPLLSAERTNRSTGVQEN